MAIRVRHFAILFALGTLPTQAEIYPDEELPEIDARAYEIYALRRSRNRSVYLFEDVDKAMPKAGSVLVLKNKTLEPILGLRVISVDAEKRTFAAKRIKTYPEKDDILETSRSYRAYEKLFDLVPPELSTEDKKDIQEVQGAQTSEAASPIAGPIGTETSENAAVATQDPQMQASPVDPELDAVQEPAAQNQSEQEPVDAKKFDSELDLESSPLPSATQDRRSEPVRLTEDEISQEESAALRDLEIEEHELKDPFGYWFSIQTAMLANNDVNGNQRYFWGTGLRWAFNAIKPVFLLRSSLQDSLALEAGLFYYRIFGFVVDDDIYHVMPLTLTARYNVLLNEWLGFYLYGGIMRNYLIGAETADEFAIENLDGVLPALGAGLWIRFGPHWEGRLDAGLEMFGAGVVFRF